MPATQEAPPAPRVDTESEPAPGASRLVARLFLVSVVAALVPVVVAAGRAIHRGWIPVGDNGLFAIRARDVLTGHHPLLGTWSSASLTAGTDLNHPGPLLFDLLAPSVRLFSSGAGVALGIALVNGAALVGIAIVAHRRGGPVLATAAMAVGAALCWTMGSEILFEPINPHSVLLPFLLFLMLLWSAACGDLWALPWAVGVGSLVLQTHLSYGVLVPAIGAWAIIGLALELRRRRRLEPSGWPALRRRAWWSGGVAGLVFVGCWAQPVVEQLFGSGKGNLSRLAEGLESPSGRIGYGRGARMIASVVALPPGWFRPSFRETFDSMDGWRPPSALATVLSLGLLAAVLAACAGDARRRDDRDLARAVATAVVALAVAAVTFGRGPVTILGVTPHQFRWLWPLAAFVTFVVVASVLRRLAAEGVPGSRLVGVLALVTIVFAALNLPTSDQGTSAPPRSIPAAADLVDGLTGVDDAGAILFDPPNRFADPYGTAVMRELQRQGVSFVIDPETDGEGWVRQLGEGRRFTGANADAVLTIGLGEDARTPPPGGRRVASHDGLDGAERRELSTLEREIGTFIGDGGLELNRRGRTALDTGELPVLREQMSDPGTAVDRLFSSREFLHIVREDLADVPARWEPRFERAVELQARDDAETVAVFLAPLGD